MDLIKDLFRFIMKRKKLWLIPLLIVLFVFGLLIVLAGGSAIAPFIYTIF